MVNLPLGALTAVPSTVRLGGKDHKLLFDLAAAARIEQELEQQAWLKLRTCRQWMDASEFADYKGETIAQMNAGAYTLGTKAWGIFLATPQGQRAALKAAMQSCPENGDVTDATIDAILADELAAAQAKRAQEAHMPPDPQSAAPAAARAAA